MSAMHPLAIVDTASITSLVRMTPYHHSISVYHAPVGADEGVAALGEKTGGLAAQNPAIASYHAAARSDDHEQPCMTDAPCSDSERKLP
jgi:hypothetical protein